MACYGSGSGFCGTIIIFTTSSLLHATLSSQLTCLLLQIERGHTRRLARVEDNLPERESLRQLRPALPRRGQEHEAADAGGAVLL